VRIDQRVLADIRAHVHEHRGMQMTPRAMCAPSRMLEPPGTMRTPSAQKSRAPDTWTIEERLAAGVNGHVHDRAHAKAEENSLFHPGLTRQPVARRGGLRSADFTAIEARLEGIEQYEVLRQISGRRNIEERFNLWLQHEFAR